MARQKQVFENAMVAHVWAQQMQDEGRSSNGNFYFVGPRLYSYGRHFVVGFITQAADGSKVTLLNASNYSMSTAKHNAYARRATSGLSFSVAEPDVAKWSFSAEGTRKGHLANLAALQKGVRDTREKAGRARSNKDWLTRSADDQEATARRYAEAFGIDPAVDAALELTTANETERRERHMRDLADCRRRLDAGRAHGMGLNEAAGIVENIRDRVRNVEGIPAWNLSVPLTPFEQAVWDRFYGPTTAINTAARRGLAELADRLASFETRQTALELYPECLRLWRNGVALGGGIAKDYSSQVWREVFAMMRTNGQLLRVSKDGAEIETSDHATFPVDHASKAFRIIAAIRASGKAWSRVTSGAGPRLGHFQIDSVDAQGNVRAGCHSVAWSEIERCAAQLGLLEAVTA